MDKGYLKYLRYFHRLDAHHKLYISAGMALVIFILTFGRFSSSIQITWLAYALSSLILAWITILTSHPAEGKHEAHSQGSSRTLVFLFAVAAAFVSLFAILILLRGSAEGSKQELTTIFIPLACVISAWWLVHTVFTLRHAHFYYCDIDHDKKGVNVKPGGLVFTDEAEPDYLDFTYFAFVLGMTSQVSDIQITSHRIRRLAWMHGVLSFAFNTIIVALTINIISGLIQK
ncbi:MAG: hypothetical protein B7X86_06650 [Sphingobacteriales bacterium 17-39-43]|uniref:DUF1345 domain-containing protein n=1 Tax=Daejeonella sp. TaxID=2805397 RepID=UPI000BDCCFF2|nr:DUF1345 domain-containing protein [Daejeonella sp.]OYZ31673.1 MAG: hypothetical protein B7Y24_07465 [Sphingobacteriales bacterium 16-39-50]OZA25068.1 MAG: hypothetical protein B7X86_06650 [Sphingobacteriales bacterium 17-39-43]OZA60723.1 MAG: hypothetical protein B7X75_03175 [Sphingobacteriales bacterium 39-40-5]HQS51290.1 DUF1345 domain-containing protein [Daejeonella sp.]HQT23653.1 DUF1345 domain-containing protein [Daejeonella sp.]